MREEALTQWLIKQFNYGFTGVVVQKNPEEIPDLSIIASKVALGHRGTQVNFKRKKATV